MPSSQTKARSIPIFSGGDENGDDESMSDSADDASSLPEITEAESQSISPPGNKRRETQQGVTDLTRFGQSQKPRSELGWKKNYEELRRTMAQQAEEAKAAEERNRQLQVAQMTNLEPMLEARLTEKMAAQMKENTAALSEMMDQKLLKAMDLAAHHTGTQIKESQKVVLDQMTLMIDTLATRLEGGRTKTWTTKGVMRSASAVPTK